MFDAQYFRDGLAAQASAAGGEPSVEIHLMNGQAHRVRSILDVTDGYVVCEAYQRRPEIAGARMQWLGNAKASTVPNEIHIAAISYDSIAQIVITPPEDKSVSRIGFSAPH